MLKTVTPQANLKAEARMWEEENFPTSRPKEGPVAETRVQG